MKFYVLKLKKNPDSAPGMAKSYTSEYPLVFERKNIVPNAVRSKSILKFTVDLSFKTQ